MSIFSQLFDAIKLLFRIIPNDVREVLEKVRPVIELIKEAIDSDTAEAIVNLTPMIHDNIARAGLSNILGKILELYNTETLEQWVEDTANMERPDKNGRLHKLTSLFVKLETGKQESQTDTYAQIDYVKNNK